MAQCDKQTIADLVSLIKKSYDKMSAEQQKGARYIIDFPEMISVSSMRTIASNIGVQPATLVRLSQTLGFSGWKELKKIFVEDATSTIFTYSQRAQTISSAKSIPTQLIKELVSIQESNIQHTFNKNVSQIYPFAQALLEAKKLYVMGYRASYPLAFSFYYLSSFLRTNVELMSGTAGTLEGDVRSMDSEDTILLISFYPYSKEALAVLEGARKIGVKILTITDSELSPLATAAEQCLTPYFESPSFFPSIVASMALIESIVEIMVHIKGPSSIDLIKEAEKQLHSTGVYTSR